MRSWKPLKAKEKGDIFSPEHCYPIWFYAVFINFEMMHGEQTYNIWCICINKVEIIKETIALFNREPKGKQVVDRY